MKAAVLGLLAALWPALASAGLNEQQVDSVMLSPGPGAMVPKSLVFQDLYGRDITLGEAIAGRPTLLLPADFTCRQICGPALTITARALQQTGLVQGRDYSLVVVGIDAQDSIDAARQFVGGQLGGSGVSVLRGNSNAIDALTRAIGYRFERDDPHDAIAHPAAIVTLSADGRVSRAMSSLALQPTDLRLALIEAGKGSIGGLTGRIALLCYGFDAVHGIYTRQITLMLQIAAASTLVVFAAAIGLLIFRSRKRGASA